MSLVLSIGIIQIPNIIFTIKPSYYLSMQKTTRIYKKHFVYNKDLCKHAVEQTVYILLAHCTKRIQHVCMIKMNGIHYIWVSLFNLQMPRAVDCQTNVHFEEYLNSLHFARQKIVRPRFAYFKNWFVFNTFSSRTDYYFKTKIQKQTVSLKFIRLSNL